MSNNINNNQEKYEQAVQAYLRNMDNKLEVAESLLNIIKGDEADKMSIMAKERSILRFFGVSSLSPSQIKELEDGSLQMLHPSRIASTVSRNEAIAFEGLQEEVQKYNANIEQTEVKIEAIDPNISNTITSLNQLLDNTSKALGVDLRETDFKQAFGEVSKIVSQFFNVVLDQVQVDMIHEEIQKIGLNPQDTTAVMELAGKSIQLEMQEQGSLGQIQDEVISDTVSWDKEKNQAQADLKTSHWYDAIVNFFGGHSGPDKAKDHAEIHQANAMLKLLREIEEEIGPMIAKLNPGMEEMSIELDNLKKKLEAFLNGHGSLLELKDAMIEALSIMVAIVADTSKDAAKYNKEMSQASQASSMEHVNHSMAQEEVILDAEKYASIMGDLLKVVQYVGMAMVFLLNPSAAMALMVAITVVLNATGAMNKLQDAIASKLGSIGGAVMTGLLEAVGTAGGAAGLEAAVSSTVIKTAVEAAEASVSETIGSLVETTAQSALRAVSLSGEEVSQEALQNAEVIVSKVVNQAVDTVQKKIADAFLSKTVSELVGSFVNGDLKVILQTASQAAAKSAAEAASNLAEIAAREGVEVISESEMTAIVEQSANEAVVNVLETTEKSAAKLGKSALSKFLTRSAFMGVSSIGSTQLPLDFMAAVLKKDKKDLNQELQIAMQLINAITQIIGMIGASGQAAEMLSNPGVFPKIVIGAQALDGAAGTVGRTGEALASFEQAHAVKAIAKDQAAIEVMQFILEQLQKSGQEQRSQYAKQMAQMGKSNIKLSMHFNDAQIAEAQVLAVSSV